MAEQDQPHDTVVGPAEGRRRREPLVLVGAIVAALVLAGGAYAAKTIGDDDADPGGQVQTPPSGGPTTPPATESTEPADPEETTDDPAAVVRCWDGSRADTVDECTEPRGARGIQWVFPSLDTTKCTKDKTETRPQIWACSARLGDGTEITLNYSQWNDLDEGLSYYRGQSYDETPWPGGRVRWLIISAAGEYKAAVMYRDEPWSVTIYAPNGDARDRALAKLVKMRPGDELRGSS